MPDAGSISVDYYNNEIKFYIRLSTTYKIVELF